MCALAWLLIGSAAAAELNTADAQRLAHCTSSSVRSRELEVHAHAQLRKTAVLPAVAVPAAVLLTFERLRAAARLPKGAGRARLAAVESAEPAWVDSSGTVFLSAQLW